MNVDLRISGTDLKLYLNFGEIEALCNLIVIQKPNYLYNFSHIWVYLTKFDAYLHKETGTFFLSQLGERPVSVQCTVSCFINIKSVKYSTFYRKWIIRCGSKKRTLNQKLFFYAFSKKSTIFIQSLRNLVKIRYSWVPYFDRISKWLGKNWGIFNKSIFLI